ncbi:MAG TPA: hypothetical protein IAA27_00930 [Candidatus Enterococcus stercoravium]|nr:hypothetical protein [Candidatus Enterococcus stercoravium]
MKEQVKEWIVDKNLTTDSFDSIMIGVIYNSGHNTLDDPDVRKWIETHPDEFRLMLPPKLTDDQQVVLEWLKGIAGNDGSLIKAVYNLYHLNLARSEIFKGNERLAKVRTALRRLTRQQEVEVLAAFAEWGMANKC